MPPAKLKTIELKLLRLSVEFYSMLAQIRIAVLLCKTNIILPSHKRRSSCQRSDNTAARRETARDLHVYSWQQNRGRDTMSETAVEICEDAHRESSKRIRNRLTGSEFLVAVEIDQVADCGDKDHDGHLLVLGLDGEAGEEDVEGYEEEVPVWIERV